MANNNLINPYANLPGLLGQVYQDPRMAALGGASQAIAPLLGPQRSPVGMGQILAAMGGGAMQGGQQAQMGNIQMQDVQQKIASAQVARDLAAQQVTAMNALSSKMGLPPGTPVEVVMEKLKAITQSGAPTATQKDYAKAQEQGYEGSLFDYQRDLASARGAGVTGGINLTPAQKAIDAKFAPTYVEWAVEGGKADTMKGISQLESVAERLEAGERLTGPEIGMQSDGVLAVTNPDALRAKQDVEEVVQRNLRLVLGAQFTEKEGERLISRAYNPMLGPETNAKSVRRLLDAIQKAATQKDRAVSHYEQAGTLSGFKSEATMTVDDIEKYAFGNVEKTSTPKANKAAKHPPHIQRLIDARKGK